MNYIDQLFLQYKLRNINEEEWFNCIVKQEILLLNKRFSLPGLPSEEIQINTTSQSGKDTLIEAFTFYLDCKNNFSKKHPLNKKSTILDFGTGWGRIARFFLKNISLENLYGCDVDKDLIEISRKLFKSNNFILNKPYPPTKFKSNFFDFIIGYSVFSHLSENASLLWIKEFNRILNPGGICAITTRGRWFFDYCRSLKNNKDNNSYQKNLSNLFKDFNIAIKKYDQGQLIYKGIGGGGIRTKDFYGETFIPKEYIKRKWGKYFTLFDFMHEDSFDKHPIIFLQKI